MYNLFRVLRTNIFNVLKKKTPKNIACLFKENSLIMYNNHFIKLKNTVKSI